MKEENNRFNTFSVVKKESNQTTKELAELANRNKEKRNQPKKRIGYVKD